MAITEKMYQLGSAARRLNDGSDELNRLLTEIDKALGRLMIGMEHIHRQPAFEITTADADGKRVIEIGYLAYTRIRGGFHLAIKTVKVLESRKQGAFEAPGTITALLEAPRRVRYRAVDLLPDLVAGLASEVDGVVHEMERRQGIAAGLLKNLESMLDPQAAPADSTASGRPTVAGH